MSTPESVLTVPQAVQILYQAVLIGQKAGVYSLNDATLVKKSLDSIRYRLHLDENFNPVGSQSPQQQIQHSVQNQLPVQNQQQLLHQQQTQQQTQQQQQLPISPEVTVQDMSEAN